jgi:protein LTV1
MGRGRNRKPRNFATFRLCPRPGAADASDRVFVRVDDNPYSVPGFADDNGGPSSSTAVGGDDEPSSSSADDGLPEHVRREILELGLPDDGYDYLAHLRELRPSLSSTGGGGSSAVFLPSRRPARSGLPVDVKVCPLSASSLSRAISSARRSS